MALLQRGELLGMFLLICELIQCSEAASEMTALITLSIAVAIPALFILVCCCSIICLFHYRNKIPIFKSFMRNARKGAGTSSNPAPTQTAKATPPAPYAPGTAPPPGSQPNAPSAGGGYEKPVEVDDVVVPIKKE